MADVAQIARHFRLEGEEAAAAATAARRQLYGDFYVGQ